MPGCLLVEETWASDAEVSIAGVDVVLKRVRTWKLWRWTRYSRTECLPAHIPVKHERVVENLDGCSNRLAAANTN